MTEVNINKNYLSNSDREDILRWILNNQHLQEFNTTTESSDTDRLAFSATFTKNNLPDIFKTFIDKKSNVYNFICVVTRSVGDIPEHVDDDLTCYMRTNDFCPMYVKLPSKTEVYYVDICDRMVGGELQVDDKQIKPETNMLVSIPGGVSHSVRGIDKCTRPRVALVCEHYRLLRHVVEQLNTPNYRHG